MDPTLMMGAMGAIGQGLAGGPSSAQSGGNVGNLLDGSGWTVSTGSGKSTGATITRPESQLPGFGSGMPTMAGYGFGGGFGGLDMNSLLMLLMVGMVVWKVAKP